MVKIKVSGIFNENIRFREYFTLNEQKTGKEKKIKLNKEIKFALKNHVKEFGLTFNDYAFVSKKGGHISTAQA